MSTATIVIPCYNEAARLDVETFLQFAFQHEHVNFLFVDDGSSDHTLDVLREIENAAPGSVRVLALSANVGKAEAVRLGVLRALDSEADHRYVGYWDADLATPLNAILDFVDVLDGDSTIELVMGSRVQLLGRRIERRRSRHYLGRMFATAASLVLGLPVYDTQCGAKLFRAETHWRAVFTQPFISRWIFDVEILSRLVRQLGSTGAEQQIYEMPLTHWVDAPGSKLRPCDFVRAAMDLARIARTCSRSGDVGITESKPVIPTQATGPQASALDAGDTNERCPSLASHSE